MDIQKLRHDAEKGLENAERDRQEAEKRVPMRLEEAVIGGIHLELYGFGFLLLGITLATVSQEIASQISRFSV